MRIKFYKFRAILFIYLIKLLAKFFFVETPPLFSVTALIKKEKKLLFVNLSYQNGLGFPGGVVKAGETLEEAIKREVLEETGLQVIKSTYYSSVFASYNGIPTASVIFEVETQGQLKESEEGKLMWLEPKKGVDKLFYKDSQIALKNYLK